MRNLPFWHLTNIHPSFLDVDSKTSVEMVAKVYGAMNELITEHNKLVEQFNKYMNDLSSENDDFNKCITELVSNYIKLLDEKILNLETYIKTNLNDAVKVEVQSLIASGVISTEVVKGELKNLIASGIFTVEGVYDEETESLNIELNVKE